MKLIDCHTHNRRSQADLSIQNFRLAKEVFQSTDLTQSITSLGLHPWDIDQDSENMLKNLPKLARSQAVVCIGEAGLDRAIATPLSVQHTVFQEHIVASEMLRKPLIIHCVRAYNEIHRLRKQNKCTQNWLLHGFQASEGMLHQLLKLEGLFFSFGKGLFSVTNANLFKNMPSDRILLETDDSGYSIEQIYTQAASIKQLSALEISELIQNNFINFLGENASQLFKQ